ncbi:hypothetical protein VSR01_17115 [Actinacidiphila sp. DG2A-62]|uniref:hypothetical protein n=1 Tax=Actinacidiphila sp. DG2A-62 TaxID=3108821 RepID=UPI002DB76299|nr:hypothetical protein [Actinacidiphila sp. DG2A-62]MEC3995159.1 hypothetical protein [Actinacidiphila sp. DG2A-62]
MGAKMWCCGGGSSSGGGGGGLAAVTVQDTPTVDLEGDGTAGNALLATVNLAADPNALEVAPDGLLVAPSAQAGNALALGSDGRLYVPTPTDTTNVVPVTGGAPVPAGTARSVDIDVTEGPADTFAIGARLSPAYGQGSEGSAFYGSVALGVPVQLSTVTVPEAGVYEVFVDARAVMNMGGGIARNAFDAGLTAQLRVNSTVVLDRPVLVFSYSTADSFFTAQSASTLLRARVALNSGDTVQAYGAVAGTTFQSGDAVGVVATVSYVKISD